MVLQVKDYGAFRHKPSTAWFVTYKLRAPRTPKRKVAREAIGTNASKAREKECEDNEIRSREYRYTRELHGASINDICNLLDLLHSLW